MTLTRQLKDARKALDELTADEAELTRLEAEQVAEIASLKASGSKDFAGLATLEGKRAALASMLSEQRTSIDQARALLVSLEAEAERTRRLERIGEIAAQTAQVHDAVRGGLDTLAEQLTTELLRLFALEQEWWNLRQAFQEEARQLGQPIFDTGLGGGEQAQALYAELKGRGVDVQALTAERLGGTPVHGGRPLPILTTAGEVHSSTPFEDRVPLMVGQLYVDAWNTFTYLEARKPKPTA
jgi:hypothetical protein